MKNTAHILLLLSSILMCATLWAQTQEMVPFIESGIAHHDAGRYDDALAEYNKALALDKKSPMVNYELALSYFMKGDLEKTIEHADVAIKQDSDFILEAYTIKDLRWTKWAIPKNQLKFTKRH